MPNATRLMQRTKVNGKNSINFTSESEKQQQSVLKNELCCLHTAVSRPFSKNFLIVRVDPEEKMFLIQTSHFIWILILSL